MSVPLDIITDEEACLPFGFLPHTRIRTTEGEGVVLGVSSNKLYCILDGNQLPTPLPGNSVEELLTNGVFAVESFAHKESSDVKAVSTVSTVSTAPTAITISSSSGIEFRTKKVSLVSPNDLPAKIVYVLQNENGPCPLIALINAFIVGFRTELEICHVFIDPSRPEFGIELMPFSVSLDYICSKITSEMISCATKNEKSLEIEPLMKMLPSLQYGLDVNLCFKSCSDFIQDSKIVVFEACCFRFYHLWVVNEIEHGKEVYNVVSKLTFNQLIECVTLFSSEVTMKEDDETHLAILLSLGYDITNLDQKEFTLTDGTKLTRKDLQHVNSFFSKTRTQVTRFGIEELKRTMKESEVGILFRNNHFSTITKRDGIVYSLVTDIGYDQESGMVWESIAPPDSPSEFFDGFFVSFYEHRMNEVESELKEDKYSQESIKLAIKNGISPENIRDNTHALVGLCKSWLVATGIENRERARKFFVYQYDLLRFVDDVPNSIVLFDEIVNYVRKEAQTKTTSSTRMN